MKIPGCLPNNTVNKKVLESIINILVKFQDNSHYSPPRRKLNSFALLNSLFEMYGQNANFVVTEVVNPVYEDYERMVK